jgi:hypothetical protein
VVKDDADVETGEKGRELDERVESRGGERVLSMTEVGGKQVEGLEGGKALTLRISGLSLNGSRENDGKHES